MASAEKGKDHFEKKLDEALEALKRCQQEQRVESCSRCDRFLGCETRSAYVTAVYDSMSKGQSGGFEF